MYDILKVTNFKDDYMKIKIVIWSQTSNYSVYADDATNEFTYGLHKKNDGTQTFIKQAIQIVKDWPDRIEDLEKLDGISYKIAYEDEKGSRQLIGSNKVPENFSTLIYLLQKNEPNNNRFLAEEEHRKRMIAESLDSLNSQ